MSHLYSSRLLINCYKQERKWSKKDRKRETEAENCKRGEELTGSEKTGSGKNVLEGMASYKMFCGTSNEAEEEKRSLLWGWAGVKTFRGALDVCKGWINAR